MSGSIGDLGGQSAQALREEALALAVPEILWDREYTADRAITPESPEWCEMSPEEAAELAAGEFEVRPALAAAGVTVGQLKAAILAAVAAQL